MICAQSEIENEEALPHTLFAPWLSITPDLLFLSLLFGFLNLTNTLYGSSSPVVQLTASNFKSKIKALLSDRLEGKSKPTGGGSSEKNSEPSASVELNSNSFDELVIRSRTCFYEYTCTYGHQHFCVHTYEFMFVVYMYTNL
ncbi:Uncharacterized protein Rs2_33966 [Raphanus sativus]|nr:Uncharacterized protein Rs2_33966 [Raphanus sativus]